MWRRDDMQGGRCDVMWCGCRVDKYFAFFVIHYAAIQSVSTEQVGFVGCCHWRALRDLGGDSAVAWVGWAEDSPLLRSSFLLPPPQTISGEACVFIWVDWLLVCRLCARVWVLNKQSGTRVVGGTRTLRRKGRFWKQYSTVYFTRLNSQHFL